MKTPRNELSDVLTAGAGKLENIQGPVLFPEIKVSRQYRFHMLQLPDQTEPRWYLNLAEAFEQAFDSNYASLTIVIEDAHYLLSKLS